MMQTQFSAMVSLFRLAILSFLPYLSHGISCYDCSEAPSKFSYIVTKDRIPPEITACESITNQTSCVIDLTWTYTFDQSEISLGPGPELSPSSIVKPTLSASALLSGYGVIQQWQHSLRYECITDQCNNLEQLKRLLSSLMMLSNFTDVAGVLEPQTGFVGSWCLLQVNTTDSQCSPVSPDKIQDCKQCFTTLTNKARKDELCATCLITDPVQQDSLQKEVVFDLTSRTRTDKSSISCRSPNCGSLTIATRIRDRSQIELDFNAFLGNNVSNRSTFPSFLVTTLFVFFAFML